MIRLLLSQIAAVALVAACATPAPESAPLPTPVPAPKPEPVRLPTPGPATPAVKAQAQKLAQGAAEQLEEGRVEEARTVLNEAIGMDPGNKLAASLLKQLTADPAATLGHESFSYAVRPGDTLSKIAGRFMGDIYQFYILGRYNNIEVPKQLQAGQTIRVPGRAPPPEPAPPVDKRPAEPRGSDAKKAKVTERKPAASRTEAASPTPLTTKPAAVASPEQPISAGERSYQKGLQALRDGDKERAYAAFVAAANADPDHPDARTRANQLREQLIQARYRNCVSAFSQQDMDAAISWCDRALELDPRNQPAKLKRQQAIELQERLKAMKK